MGVKERLCTRGRWAPAQAAQRVWLQAAGVQCVLTTLSDIGFDFGCCHVEPRAGLDDPRGSLSAPDITGFCLQKPAAPPARRAPLGHPAPQPEAPQRAGETPQGSLSELRRRAEAAARCGK